MLDHQDKQWITQTIGQSITQALASFGQSEWSWFSQELASQLDQLRLELCQVMAEGFAEAASATHVEDLRLMVAEGFAERASSKQANRIEAKLERAEKKQSNKTAAVVQQLYKKHLLSGKEANVILAMEPYPRKVLSK